DLVVESVRLFLEQPARLAVFNARLPFILVDEFQDTNVAQITLVATLAGRTRNLCVVGDDDQAIYRFRGASYASFLLFQERFPDAATVRLTQNYRSSPRILRTAGRVIRGNGDDRYDPDKSLWTARPPGPPVELLVCADYGHEAQVIADKIRTLLGSSPVPSIAVLYRAHAHRERLVERLAQEQIPHTVVGGQSLLESEAVQDVVACLRLVHDPSDSVHAFRVLGLPIIGLALPDLVQVARAAKQQQRSIEQALRIPKAVTLRPDARQRARRFRALLQTWQRAAARGGVEGVTRRVLEEIGYRPRLYAAAGAEAQAEVMALSRWYRFVQQAIEIDPARRDLGAFLRYLDFYQEAGGEFKDDAADLSGTGKVQLMTIHQAKGLEFDWVFLPSLVQGRFPSRSRPEAIPFPVALMKERLPAGDFHLQEERRLCYVAMTRARDGLVLTTVERPYHRPSVFVREAAGDDLARVELPPPTVLEQVQPPLARPALALLEQEQAIIGIMQSLKRLAPDDARGLEGHLAQLTETARALVAAAHPLPVPGTILPLPVPGTGLYPVPDMKDLKLSFSQLETYRFCPSKYQYAYVYQIPTRPTAQMQLGTNVHACLEALGRQLMAGQTPSLEEVLAIYEAAWTSDGYADPAIEARDKAYGRQMIADYYERNRATWQPPLFVEKSFLLQVGDAWLRGFIDRIDSRPDGRVEIVDYKTGKPKTKAEVGDRLQLTIYAMACRDVLGVTPETLSFYYLQTNEKLSFPYDEAALDEAAQTITAIAQKIRAGEFTPTPDYGKCRICDFRTICPAATPRV
ncbi:MAG: ATP-dependent helicase, partial [Candidatus Omnitrophica bacterium]|nr:ATP-dependent helicase [Candidatus Omnitrophota bacterium]